MSHVSEWPPQHRRPQLLGDNVELLSRVLYVVSAQPVLGGNTASGMKHMELQIRTSPAAHEMTVHVVQLQPSAQ